MQTMRRYSKEELDITVVEANDRENQQKFYELLGKEWILLGGFVLVAFLIRLWMVKFDTRLEGDDVWYATLGKNLISGNFRDGLSTYWPPLYPVLVGLSSLLFHDLEFAGRFVSIAAGSLLVIPVYLLGRNLYGNRIASIGAFFVIINPLLISVSTGLMTESTYALT